MGCIGAIVLAGIAYWLSDTFGFTEGQSLMVMLVLGIATYLGITYAGEWIAATPERMRGFAIAVGILLMVGLVAVFLPNPKDPIPNVIGMRPDKAVEAIHKAGYSKTRQIGSTGLFSVDSLYRVCAVRPGVGTKPSTVDLENGKVLILSRFENEKRCPASGH